MVLIFDGNSEIGAHARSNLNFCCLFMAFEKIENKQEELFSFMRAQHVLSYHLI